MKQLVFLLSVMIMTGGISSAQETRVESNQLQVFWEQNIDTTTEWGKWLTATYKPYLEKQQEALARYLLPLTKLNMTDMPELSADEIQKKTNQAQSDYYKAIQSITPPPELRAYHSKMLEIFAEKIKATPPKEELIDKLLVETSQELVQVFMQHGVPQKIIDKFTKKP
jgi:hypothetical protein